MICDAHVHVGYFPRKGFNAPFYYSPRRVLGILTRAGIDSFIFSSTNSIWDYSADSMHREAKEMLRLAGGKAHPFFWVTDAYLQYDCNIERIPIFYEGFKLHGGETPWLHNKSLLERVLSIAYERRFPVQIHTGKIVDNGKENRISEYIPFCKKYKDVIFDLCHGYPSQEVVMAVNQNDNVYVDCAYCQYKTVKRWLNDGAREDRILFGSDIPVQQRTKKLSLTQYLRETLKFFSSPQVLYDNFHKFLFGHRY